MLKLISMIPIELGWAMVGFVACLCLLLLFYLIAIVIKEYKSLKEFIKFVDNEEI